MAAGTLAELRDAHIDLMNRYALAMDSRDWTGFASLFTPDAAFSAQQGPALGNAAIMALDGRDALVGALSAIIESLSATHHMLSNYIVDAAEDGRSAKAACHFRAYHAGAGPRAHLFEESLGRFEIETVRGATGWQIRRMHETILVMLGTAEAFGVGP